LSTPNYILRNDDGSTRQESERHSIVVWGLHAEKAARLLRKGSKIRVQGRMTYLTWKDKQTGATRYGAEIVAQTLDYQGAGDETEAPVATPVTEAPAPQPAEPIAPIAEAPARQESRARRGVKANANWRRGNLPRRHFVVFTSLAASYDRVYNRASRTDHNAAAPDAMLSEGTQRRTAAQLVGPALCYHCDEPSNT
jgi:single stranded DNA-binding protein